ncbi:uncharacterized protein [Musca autumnalis]|uniref:uncharacterized protein n=1 Tax=Musca autumnalis TaxID=221902 RepID=UPI003CEEE0DF
MELTGKNIVYVGGFGGIGEKTVEAFLKKSVKSVLILDLQSNDEYLKYLQSTYKNSVVAYIPVDLTKTDSIREAFQKAKEQINTFDVVVNGAGIGNELNIDRIVQINLIGVIHSSLIAMDYMSKENGGQGGCIVNISSTSGLNPTALLCIYGTTKSGLNYFTNTLAKPLYFEKSGVSFITICPGVVITPMMNDASNLISAKYFPNVDRVFNSAIHQTPTVFAENLMKVLETATNVIFCHSRISFHWEVTVVRRQSHRIVSIMELKGKNVIYVGGFGGIGEKCIESFLMNSVKSLLVFDLHCNEEFLNYLQNTYKQVYVDYIHLDISKGENIRTAFKKAKDKISTFEVVVNGAGIIDEGKINQIVQINLTGLIQYMSKANGGQGGYIVNISSIAGLNPCEIFSIYGVTKSAVLHFTRALGKSVYFNKTGVSFITICPGGTASPMFEQALSKFMGLKYLPELISKLEWVEPQGAETFANNLMIVLKIAANGSTWILDNGKIEEITFPEIWGPVVQFCNL